MDWIRISDTKLKIMLTSSDMALYDLHTDSISIADHHVRNILRKLLADTKELTGFDSDMTHLYIQMYPCADGGCELFISKSDSIVESASFGTLPTIPHSTQQKQALYPANKVGKQICIYSFSRLSHLIAVCKHMSRLGFSGQSNAYIDRGKTYYLEIRDLPTSSLYAPDEYCILGEYGNRENSRIFLTYLCEYCAPICEDDAIHTLAAL